MVSAIAVDVDGLQTWAPRDKSGDKQSDRIVYAQTKANLAQSNVLQFRTDTTRGKFEWLEQFDILQHEIGEMLQSGQITKC